MMTRVQLEQVRLSLLRYCAAAGTYGLTVAVLQQFLRSEGWRGLDESGVCAELDYLTDKGLLARVHKLVSPEVAAWRATACGRDYLAAQEIG